MRSAFDVIPLSSHSHALPDVIALQFDYSGFAVDAFAAFGIACPSSIERSVVKRQAEYLAGRRVAREALCRAGIAEVDLPIGPSRAPLWPSGFVGSISHCEGLAVAIAVSSENMNIRGVGIDIERIVGEAELAAIRHQAVTINEERSYRALTTSLGDAVAATIAFSAKESFYKAISARVNRIVEFEALEIIGIDIRSQVIGARISQFLAPGLNAGHEIRIGYSIVDETTIMTTHAW
ncbi:4'-phosphopantetheinyl transferase [Xanthomonas citri]|uniref:4'-phosphopantetheinyl transferase family protein n=1 Tax=Xanthomonas citri TaxID=346 RepID=UPI0005293F75|nr:4'-phosphopantetheinyl transferase superfamily protein [Xanthomonas citri]